MIEIRERVKAPRKLAILTNSPSRRNLVGMSIKPKDLTAIRMGGDLVESLKAISAQPGGYYSERSVNWLIVQAVKEFIERQRAEASDVK
jgi:hypothetical protein